MKLAIVKTSYNPINTQSYNVQEIGLAKGLLNLRVSTDFYSLFSDIAKETTIAANNGCEIKLIPLKLKMFLNRVTYSPQIIDILAKGEYDIVQVHEDSQLMTPLILKQCRKRGIKTLLYQGMYVDYKGIGRLYQIFLDLLFKKTIQKNADIIFAKTTLAKNYLKNKGYKNVGVLPVGLDIQEQKECQIQDTIENFKSQFKKILLYIGIIEERRNPFFLIDILSQMDSDTAMIIVGKGPLYNSIKQYAKDKKVINRLLLIESVPNSEIHAIFKVGDIFLLPTNYEIYGMVVMEALLNGIPVISTPEAGPLSILNDKKLGVCLQLDSEEWIMKINEYLDEGTGKYAAIRSQTIKEKYNWNKIAQQWASVVANVL
jgi:glycosyltransferase involved in cell wall biosynthesis